MPCMVEAIFEPYKEYETYKMHIQVILIHKLNIFMNSLYTFYALYGGSSD